MIYKILLFIIVSTACSHVREGGSPGSSVSITEPNAEISSPTIEGPSGAMYGPSVQEEADVFGQKPSKKQQKEPVVALFLGPGAYKAFGHAGVIKAFEENGIKVHIISGTGIGALVASLYAKSSKSSLVEWSLFKLFQKVSSDIQVFTPKWRSVVRDYLDSEFKKMRIEESKVALRLPLYDEMKNSPVIYRKGKIAPLLLEMLDFDRKRRNGLFPYMIKNNYDENFLKKSGADIVFFIDVIGQKFTLNMADGYTYGIFANLVSKIQTATKNLPEHFYVECGDDALDNISDLASFLLDCETQGEKVALEAKEIIESWKERNN